MKILFLFIISFASTTAFALNLEEAQALAIKNSANLKVLESEIGEAKARRDSTYFLGRPQVGVAGGAEFEGNDKERDVLPLAYGYIAFTVYDGYQARIEQSAAEKGLERTQLQIPYREFETKKVVEDIFLEVAYRDLLLKAMQNESLLFDRLKSKAISRRGAGLIGDADVYEFELRKTVLIADMEALQIEKKNLIRKLSFLTGVEGESIQGYSMPEVLEASLALKPDLMNSLEGRVIAKEQELLVLGKNAIEAKWGPQVELEARAGRLPSEGELEKHKPRVDALLVAKWELFTRGQKNAASQEIIERQKTLGAKANEELTRTQNLIQTATQNLEYLKSRAMLHKRKVSPTNRYYKAMMDEYERGIKNSPDLAHAAELLFQLEYQGLEIRRDWAKQKIELEKASFQAL